MMTFRKISAESSGRLITAYFTQELPDPEHDFRAHPGKVPDADGGRLTSYYTGRDGRASWRPDMQPKIAAVLGIDPRTPPKNVQLNRLFEAKRADNGDDWSRNARKISAYDLTLAPHKSVTLAAEFAPTEAERAAIWHAIDQANDATMLYVAREIGFARRGHGGENGAYLGEVAWVSFRHDTARPTVEARDAGTGQTYLIDTPAGGDPHAHIHNALFNVVVTEKGHVGSLDTKRLRSRVHEFGAYFQAQLADELRRIGIAQQYDANEQATVISAVPQDISDFFSKGRRNVIRAAKDYAAAEGLDWAAMPIERKRRILSVAGLAARLDKDKGDSDREIWREQATRLGWEERSLLGMPIAPAGTRSERYDVAYRFAARHLAREFETAAVIDHDKLRTYAARGLIGTGIEGGVKDIDHVVSLIEQRGLELRGEEVLLIEEMRGNRLRVTNSAQIAIEEDLAIQAARASGDRSGALSDRQITEAIGRSPLDFESEHGTMQKAAIYAFGRGGALSMLTGVAGSGKTALLSPLVDAWKHDTRHDTNGRRIIGIANAWRQADALRDAGICDTSAMPPFLARLERGDVDVDRNTVLVIDEVGQVGPRQMLRLLQLQRDTGCTIKALGDHEQAQNIEAGDSIEMLRRVLDPEDMPELLSSVRQVSARNRQIADLFRGAEPEESDLEADEFRGAAANAHTDEENDDDVRNRFHLKEVRDAIDMKRADGTIRLVGGDHEEVLQDIARLYVTRRDALVAEGAGPRRGRAKTISMSALTNQDAADLSRAVRKILQERGEISTHEIIVQAIDQRGETYDLAIATGDRLRLYRRTWGSVDGKGTTVGNNGDVVEVLAHSDAGLRVRVKDGLVADVEWRRFRDAKTGRVLLGFGHAMTIDAAQGLTSDEHINAMPRGAELATGFTSYVAESRARGTTWTMISDGATFEAVRNQRALGDTTPVTSDDLWNHVAKKMAYKPYKSLGTDLVARTRKARDARIRELIALGRTQETLAKAGRRYGREIIIGTHARQAERVHKARLAEIDARLRSIITNAPAVMTDAEQMLRSERASRVLGRSRQLPSASPDAGR
ncbi:MobF family relaxase [Novacetimonas pomaceti]|uniref:MobF family relaxase n=1 Tax=Novacetimonas pomaceti TaxID=2021998 RepID=UPI001C2DC754|nr:MobF family relaxase [Novacetimonas pomaceti]MBV1835391.1 relaxase domain-containing protein [Novacetimonas pomaceti]